MIFCRGGFMGVSPVTTHLWTPPASVRRRINPDCRPVIRLGRRVRCVTVGGGGARSTVQPVDAARGRRGGNRRPAAPVGRGRRTHAGSACPARWTTRGDDSTSDRSRTPAAADEMEDIGQEQAVTVFNQIN